MAPWFPALIEFAPFRHPAGKSGAEAQAPGLCGGGEATRGAAGFESSEKVKARGSTLSHHSVRHNAKGCGRAQPDEISLFSRRDLTTTNPPRWGNAGDISRHWTVDAVVQGGCRSRWAAVSQPDDAGRREASARRPYRGPDFRA